MRHHIALILFALLLIERTASAQIIYEPIQYQFVRSGDVFYYGGSDPRRVDVPPAINFGLAKIAPAEVGRPVQILSDKLLTQNAALFGYTIDEVRNDAYRAVPTYFCKHDLLASASFETDGALHVSPTAGGKRGSISIRVHAAGKTLERPILTHPKPILILPRIFFDPPAPREWVTAWPTLDCRWTIDR